MLPCSAVRFDALARLSLCAPQAALCPFDTVRARWDMHTLFDDMPWNTERFERHMMNAIVIYLSLVFVMSVVCFTAYGLDKRRAVNGSRRVPEQTLHMLALLGGWPGGLLGQQQFRHKTKKLSFVIVFWCVVMLHVAAISAAAYVLFGSTSSGRTPLQNPTSQE